jgi:signal transduction histidine kinase
VRPAKLLALLFAAVFLPAAAFTAVGLRSLAADAERAETRYREQAALLARNVDDALRAVVAEVELGGAGCVKFSADAQGTLIDPPVLQQVTTDSAEDRSLIAVLRNEIDELERKGELERAVQRLQPIAAREEQPALAAWALDTLAALHSRAGASEDAQTAWKQLVSRFPNERDERGLKRSFAARFALGDDGDLCALLRELNDDRASLNQTANAALAARVAERLRATAPNELAQLEATAREHMRSLRVQASWRRGISDWIAQGAPDGARLFELATDPLASDARAERVLVAAHHAEDGTWTGGALESTQLAQSALSRPEIATWRTLGFRAALSDNDGALLAGETTKETRGVVERPSAVFDELRVRAFGTDLDGYLAGERRRFVWVATLSGVALLVALVAALATVRAVMRESHVARERESFVAAVTHELKAPLASIRLLAELLARGDVEEAKVREFGARTVAESDRLSRLVSSVLELARIEQGATNGAVRERVDLGDLALSVVAQFEPLARAKSVTVELRAPEQPIVVLGEPDALSGALFELLENALKYGGDSRAIEVELAANDSATLAVLDRGPGVPESAKHRVFEPFRRLGDELTRERPGVGLGLALVARIALAHGGSARCVARVGGGSRFEITLPRAQ